MAGTVQATLKSARLELVPISPEHYEFTKRLDMNPKVMEHVGFGRPFTVEETRQSHTWLMDSSLHPVWGHGLASPRGVLSAGGYWRQSSSKGVKRSYTLIDQSLVSDCHHHSGDKDTRRKGPANWFAMLSRIFGLVEVIGEKMTVNVASRAVMAGCGLKHVDTFLNKYDTPPPGIEEGEVRYAIAKDDWLSQTSAAGFAKRQGLTAKLTEWWRSFCFGLRWKEI